MATRCSTLRARDTRYISDTLLFFIKYLLSYTKIRFQVLVAFMLLVYTAGADADIAESRSECTQY
jgi:hypothetical protein